MRAHVWVCGCVGAVCGHSDEKKKKKPRSPRLPPRSPPSIPPLSSPRSLPLPPLTQAKSLEGHVPTVIPGAPGWSEKLASDSEAVVKAERAAAEFAGAKPHKGKAGAEATAPAPTPAPAPAVAAAGGKKKGAVAVTAAPAPKPAVATKKGPAKKAPGKKR